MPAAKRKPAAPLAEPSGKKNSVSGSVSSEEDVFASRVAMHLREFATASETRDDAPRRPFFNGGGIWGTPLSPLSSSTRFECLPNLTLTQHLLHAGQELEESQAFGTASRETQLVVSRGSIVRTGQREKQID